MAKKSKKIRISIKSFDHRLLDEAVKKIVSLAKDSGVKVVWPVPLPTKIQKVTVNRSTFVNKDAREQFEIRRHRRIVEILEPNAQTLDFLQNINIPTWVWVEISEKDI